MGAYGTLGRSYHLERKAKKSLKYRLKRRTEEVVTSIKKYYSGTPKDFIDLGTADGLMLSMIKDYFPSARCVGLEYSLELLETNKDNRITIIQGDVNALPIQNKSFDIAIAAAIIEHLPNPKKMLEEAKRVLRRNGILILTSPDPFWEKIATMIGHLHKEQHFKLMKLKELISLFKEVGYDIVNQNKFMLSPFGMPLEIPIENFVRKIGLHFLFANQLIIGKKVEH